MALVKQTMPGFRLSVFGPHRPALELLAAAKGLQDHIRFYAEVPQPELAGYMRQADALILYSRYETFGCVLIEANASGIPAIVSDIPVHHETISEGENGYFAEGDNAAALAGTLCRFMQQHHAGSRAAIAAGAREKYNYERVGRLFAAFYQNMLQP
jgi:glycosyltransferase involved in cell wall biosynthesis